MLYILPSTDPGGNILRASRRCRKVEGIADAKLGEMMVDFGSIDGFASEHLLDLIGMNALVIKRGRFVDVKSVGVAGDRLQERCTAGAWGT